MHGSVHVNGSSPARLWLRGRLTALRGRAIGIRPIRLGDDRVFVDSVDRYLAALAWKWRLRDGPAQRLIERRVTPGMVAVDVGANLGCCSLALARRVGATGKVYALEPEPANVDLLTRALGGGRLPQVEVRQVAAAEHSGWMTLYVAAVDRGDHRIVPADEPRRMVTVRAVSLDDLLAEAARVDFLRLSVQGAEAAALRGLRRTLARHPQLAVLCAVSPALLTRAGTDAAAVFAPLRDAGLQPHCLAPDGTPEPLHAPAAWALAQPHGRSLLYFAR